MLELARAAPSPDVVQLGRGMPDVTSPTLRPLTQALGRISRRSDMPGLYYDNIHGRRCLREQVARLLLDSGTNVDPDDLMITTGAQEALAISIRSVCEPGDIVAVDSPSFHGAMQALKGLGMKALEIPTDPLTGISRTQASSEAPVPAGRAGASSSGSCRVRATASKAWPWASCSGRTL